MAAPQFVPVDPIVRPRAYESPDHVPAPWSNARPASIDGRQPSGTRLGTPGPDQGYALLLAERVRPRVVVAAGESVDDALAGCLGVALRRAALFGRAPVIHDLTVALTVWGFLDPNAPADLVALRQHDFDGVRHLAHHYAEARAIADRVPEATLRMSPDQATRAYQANWRTPLGL
jgi:hypothetical protein